MNMNINNNSIYLINDILDVKRRYQDFFIFLRIFFERIVKLRVLFFVLNILFYF